MAWTAPASGSEFSVGELVTAAKMNSKITDNLRYLKGLDGAVTIDDRVNIPLTSGTNGKGLRFGDSSNQYANIQGLDLSGDSFIFFGTNRQFDGTGWQQLNTRAAGMLLIDQDAIGYHTFPASSSTPTQRWAIDNTGNMGVGLASPQGRIHSYGSISGFLKWEYDGLDGTARTVVPDGAGDVLYGLTYWAIVRGSAGAVVPSTNSAGTAIAPGGMANIPVGADTVQVQVAANGAVTVQRTAGSQTHKVSLICQWL